MKILIAEAFDAHLPGRLAAFGEVSRDMATLGEAEVLLVRSKVQVDGDLLAQAPRLKLVMRGGVGMDNIDAKACEARGIRALNTPQASKIAVAELAMAFMVAIPARLIEAHLSMKEGKFLKKDLVRTELYGKTLGLVGAGNIATEVARRAQAFGMEVLAYDPHLSEHPMARLMPSLEDLVAQCDFLSLHLPLTASTRRIINAQVIDRMKPGIILINTGRGKCVVEEDLAEALRSGKVRAYGTDVFQSDPPPADSPILAAPHVYLSPHIGANSEENLTRIGDAFLEILEEYAARKS